MRRWCIRLVPAVMVTIALAAMLMFTGCEGTESRNQVDDTVEELAGKKHVDRMNEMKANIDHIQTQQADRMKQLDDTQ